MSKEPDFVLKYAETISKLMNQPDLTLGLCQARMRATNDWLSLPWYKKLLTKSSTFLDERIEIYLAMEDDND